VVRLWVGKIRCSDHFLIYLEIDRTLGKSGSPFKYNSDWEDLDKFRDLVKANWKLYSLETNENASSQFVASLQYLKKTMAAWAKERRNVLDAYVCRIEVELEDINKLTLDGSGSQGIMDSCKLLQAERYSILVEQEKAWTLKSRALWLSAGDKNTIFFQKNSKHGCNFNSIWELKDS